MQITLTHNSELRLRKVDALHRMHGTEYPISGDNHHPTIGEEVELAKHGGYHYTEQDARHALNNVTRHVQRFKTTNHHTDLTTAINALEGQETLF